MKWSEEQCGEFMRLEGRKLVERFAGMKWISGTNLVSSSDFKLEFTSLGRDKISEIARLAQSYIHAVTVKESRYPLWSFCKSKWKTRHIVNAMPGPVMESRELIMLFTLAHGYTQLWSEQEREGIAD